MNGSTISWDETAPSGTEMAGTGNISIISTKISLRSALNDEHNWPTAGGAGFGYHRRGTARPYFGTQSRVSSDGTDSRLMLTSDTSRLFGLTSAGTVLLGGPTLLSIATFASVLPQRHYWAMEFGGDNATPLNTDVGGEIMVTFPNSGFSGRPLVFLTPVRHPHSAATFSLSVDSITATDFYAVSLDGAGGYTSNITFNYISIGSRVL